MSPSGVGVQKVLVTTPGTAGQVQGEKRIIIQNMGGQQQQQIILNRGAAQLTPTSGATVGQQIIIGNQKYVLSTVQSPQPQTTTQQVQQSPIQLQIQQQPPPEPPKPAPQQIVVQNSSIAQQLAEGKVQLANYNGQQVLIRQIGNGQAQIVGHVKTNTTVATPQSPQTPTQQHIVKQTQIVQQQTTSSPQVTSTVTSSPQQQQQQHQIVTRQIQIQQPIAQTDEQQMSAAVEQSLLAGQPPGTIIKCVTAQVVQTQNGPRIVLQGLQGSDFTQQQTQLVQQQVKQQLLKGERNFLYFLIFV